MKEIKLNESKVSKVSDEDFDRLSAYNWWFECRYAARRIVKENGKVGKVYLHREIYPDWKEIDHINGDKLDNRRENLRPCNRSLNNANKNKQINGTSGYKGVYKNSSHCVTKIWRAAIGNNGKYIHIGIFKTKEEAALAYNEKAKELYGDFAKLSIL